MRRHARFAAGELTGIVLAAALFAVGCVPEPVKWEHEERAPAKMLPGSRVVFDARGLPGVIAEWKPPLQPAGDICEESLVATQARGDTAFAAWWSPAGGGRVRLLSARSDDGGLNWHEPEVADSSDHGTTGCKRLPPFVTADTVNGYVHIVYFMVAKEGPGVFFTHSMTGGTMFHAPVPIVYGERESAAAVASHGDTVAVAFEDPNAADAQMTLAISTSAGHIFEHRASVSSSSVTASHPSVAVQGRKIAVGWNESSRAGGSYSAVIRVGKLQ